MIASFPHRFDPHEAARHGVDVDDWRGSRRWIVAVDESERHRIRLMLDKLLLGEPLLPSELLLLRDLHEAFLGRPRR